jgi:hypothetical protein
LLISIAQQEASPLLMNALHHDSVAGHDDRLENLDYLFPGLIPGLSSRV